MSQENLNATLEAIHEGRFSFGDAFDAMVKVQGRQIIDRGFTENLLKDLSIDFSESELKDSVLNPERASNNTEENLEIIDELQKEGYLDEETLFDSLSNWHGAQIFDDDYMKELHDSYDIGQEEDDELSFSELDTEAKAAVLQAQLNIIASRGDWRKCFLSTRNANGEVISNPCFNVEVEDDKIHVKFDAFSYSGSAIQATVDAASCDFVIEEQDSSREMLSQLESEIFNKSEDFSLVEYMQKVNEENDLSLDDHYLLHRVLEDAKLYKNSLNNFALAFCGAVNNNLDRLEREEIRATGNNVIFPLDQFANSGRLAEFDNLKFRDYDIRQIKGIYLDEKLVHKLQADLDELIEEPTLTNFNDKLENSFYTKDIINNDSNLRLLLCRGEEAINDDLGAFLNGRDYIEYDDFLYEGVKELYYQAFTQSQDNLVFNCVVDVIQNKFTESEQIALLNSLSPDEKLEDFVENFISNIDDLEEVNSENIQLKLASVISEKTGIEKSNHLSNVNSNGNSR